MQSMSAALQRIGALAEAAFQRLCLSEMQRSSVADAALRACTTASAAKSKRGLGERHTSFWEYKMRHAAVWVSFS